MSDKTSNRPPGAGPGRASLAESLGGLVGVLARHGRDQIERAAGTARVRLDLRQLRQDREVMYQKLGQELRALLESGEIQHEGLARRLARIRELDQKITLVETELSVSGARVDPEDPKEP